MLLFVITYLAAVLFMQGLVIDASAGEISPDHMEDLETFFRSLWHAFVALIMCFTGGEDWSNIMRPLARIHWIYEAVFVLYILFVVMGVLNVLTGIFVERA